MPFKISQGKGNNARPRIIAGENTINIVAATGVSKSTVNLMKRQSDAFKTISKVLGYFLAIVQHIT